MLPSYFDYIFVHLKQKVRLRPELSPNFLSILDPNPTRKAGPTYNSDSNTIKIKFCDVAQSVSPGFKTQFVQCCCRRRAEEIAQFSEEQREEVVCNLLCLFGEEEKTQ